MLYYYPCLWLYSGGADIDVSANAGIHSVTSQFESISHILHLVLLLCHVLGGRHQL